jgi:hypothetical protein
MKKRASKAKDRTQAAQEIEAQLDEKPPQGADQPGGDPSHETSRAMQENPLEQAPEVAQPLAGDNPPTTGEEKGPEPGSNDEDPQRQGWESAVTSHAGTGDEITPDAAQHLSETLPEASAAADDLEKKLADSRRRGGRATAKAKPKVLKPTQKKGSPNQPHQKRGWR